MTSVFFISIRPSLDHETNTTTDLKLKSSGLNLGNMLFTDALHRQLKYDTAEMGFDFDPAYVQERFDYIAIPAANWVGTRTDFGHLAGKIEKTTLPVLMVGLGAQAPIAGEIPQMLPGNDRFLRIVSERCKAIGVRGAFSAEVLNHYGIANTDVIGCPSLFWHCLPQLNVAKAPRKRGRMLRVTAGSTRYGLNDAFAAIDPESDVNKLLFQLCYERRWPYLVQSEPQEARFAFEGKAVQLTQREWARLCDVYGSRSPDEMRRYLRAHAVAFSSVADWIEYARTRDFYIGSRLHGAISFLLAQKPAVLACHDSRTAEMAETAAIPQVTSSDLQTKTAKQIYAEADIDGFNRRWPQLYSKYRNFLNLNGAGHNLPNPTVKPAAANVDIRDTLRKNSLIPPSVTSYFHRKRPTEETGLSIKEED